MAGVLCETVSPGMRESERAATMRDMRGNCEVILLEHDVLAVQGDRMHLPGGVVAIDKDRGVVLVQLPHEAITGGTASFAPLTSSGPMGKTVTLCDREIKAALERGSIPITPDPPTEASLWSSTALASLGGRRPMAKAAWRVLGWAPR